MKPKNLIILVVVAVVLAGLAVLTKRDKGTATPDILGKAILPDLPVNDITRIVVEAKDATTTVERVEGTWVATSKYGYPADFGKVRDALMKLSELKIGQVARLNDEQRDALKVHPPAEENGGTLLSLQDASGKTLGSLLLGETHERKSQGGPGSFGGYPDGRFVSTDDGKTVYLVDETLSDVSTSTKDWLQTDLLNVSGSEVMEVSITGPDRAPISLKRPEKGKTMELGDLGEKEELKTSKMYNVESAISYLRLSDVAGPEMTDEQLGLDKPVVFQAVTISNEIYTVKVGGSPDGSSDRYIRIACSMRPAEPEPEKVEAEDETEEEKKEAEEKAKAEAEKKAAERKKAEDRINALNDGLGKWTFVIESYKADSMLTKRADIVEEKKEEEQDEDKDEKEKEDEESDTSDRPEKAGAPREPAATPPEKPAEVEKAEPPAAAPATPPAKPAETTPAKPAPATPPEPATPAEAAPKAPAKPATPAKAEPATPAKPAVPAAKEAETDAAAKPPAKTE